MKSTILLAALAMFAAPVANATVLVDGSFEAKGAAGSTGGTPVTGYCYDFGAYGDGQCLDTSNWNGTGVVRSGNGAWGGTTAADGNYFSFVQGTQSTSQTFTIADAGNYTLAWVDAGRTNNGGPQTYTVTITGGASPLALGSYTTNYSGWTAQSALANLGAGTYTLTFAGQSNEDRTSFIDAVSLSAVPEPATWGMMIAGFGIAGASLRRRRTAGIALA